MSQSSKDARSGRLPGELSQLEAIEALIRHVEAKRSIVPLLGAGISVDAGIPTLADLRQYLAKVQLYTFDRLYRPQAWEENESQWEKRNPSGAAALRYLKNFGWPDPHQLESELWHWLDVDSKDEEDTRKPDLPRASYIRKRYGKALRHRMKRLVQLETLDSFRQIENDLVEKIHRDLKDPESKENAWNVLDRLHGDWQLLLSRLTRSSPDHADTLFRRFLQRRQPATAHRYLTFLTPFLRLKLFLTTNFDNLIEESLRIEGYQPNVYEIAVGAPLPHHSLIQDDISIVKLHGGAFGLRVDASLDTPLDAEAKHRLRSYLPEKPVLLVLGLSGWDQRVLDLVEIIEEKAGEVFWVRFEAKRPEPVKWRFQDSRLPFKHVQVRNPGSFLKDFYGRLARNHAPSRKPYDAYAIRPIPILDPPEKEPIEKDRTRRGAGEDHANPTHQDDRPIKIFFDLPFAPPMKRRVEGEASFQLAQYVSDKSRTHKPIWIDLESKYNVHDIVADLFSQLRRYDPTLPPVNSIVERTGEDKIIFSICRALDRGRYLVAFDGVEAFSRSPTVHHARGQRQEEDAVDQGEADGRVTFLKNIFRAVHHYGDWTTQETPNFFKSEKDADFYRKKMRLRDTIVAFSISHNPAVPEDDGSLFWEEVKESRSRLVRVMGTARTEPVLRKEHLGDLNRFDKTLHFLSCFRRRRSFVALASLLGKYIELDRRLVKQSEGDVVRPMAGEVDKKDVVDEFLIRATFPDTGPLLLPVEGGYYWMNRNLRDEIYDANRSNHIDKESLKSLSKKSFSKHNEAYHEAVNNLILKSATHFDIAKYYLDLYGSERAVSALFEHLYHHISGLRYLTKLDAWVSNHWPVEPLDVPSRFARGEIVDFAWRLWALEEDFDHAGQVFDVGGRRERSWQEWHRFIRFVRLRSLMALAGIIEREKGRLLSNLPNATLIDWIKWVRKNDCERFSIKTYPLLKPEKDKLPSDDEEKERLEAAIEERREGFEKLLKELEAEAHSDRMDLKSLLKLLISGDSREKAPGDVADEVERCDDVETLKQRYFNRFSADNSELVESLESFKEYYQAAVLDLRLSLDESADLETWQDVMEDAIRQRAHKVRNDGEIFGDKELWDARLLCWSYEVDRLIFRKNVWEEKGRSQVPERLAARDGAEESARVGTGGERDRLRKDAECVKETCDKALQYLDWIRESSPVFRAYFHSMRGRAYALYGQDFYDEAQRDLNAARRLVHGNQSGDSRERRQVYTITLLRLAEFLMLKSDDDLLGRCEAELQKDGKIDVAGYRCLSRFDIEHLEYLDTKRTGKKGGLSSAEGDEPWLVAYENLLQGRRQQLQHAEDLIDLAERVLEHGRHDSEWWSHLYQLRAQLKVEKLLLMIAGEGYLEIARNRREGDLKNVEMIRNRQVGRFVRFIREGLQATRYGLDIVLPDPRDRIGRREELEADERLKYFIRLWIELWICGMVLTRLAENEMDLEKADDEEIWQRWRRTNQIEGLWKLPESKEPMAWWRSGQGEALEKWLEKRTRKMQGQATGLSIYGLASRGRTLGLIRSALSRRRNKEGKWEKGKIRRELLDIIIRGPEEGAEDPRK